MELKNEIKKTRIADFVEGYEKCPSNSMKEKYLKEKLVIAPYVKLEHKLNLCQSIVEASSHNKQGDLHIDSAARYILYIRCVIECYTNLTLNDKAHDKSFIKEYDQLARNGLIDRIVKMIPKDEMEELSMFLDMKVEDLFTNEYETKAFISKQVDKFSKAFDAFMPSVVDSIANEFVTRFKGIKREELIPVLIELKNELIKNLKNNK